VRLFNKYIFAVLVQILMIGLRFSSDKVGKGRYGSILKALLIR